MLVDYWWLIYNHIIQHCQPFYLTGHCLESMFAFIEYNPLPSVNSLLLSLCNVDNCEESAFGVMRQSAYEKPLRPGALLGSSSMTFSEFLVKHFEIHCFGNSDNFLNIVLYRQDAVLNFTPSVIYSCLFK